MVYTVTSRQRKSLSSLCQTLGKIPVASPILVSRVPESRSVQYALEIQCLFLFVDIVLFIRHIVPLIDLFHPATATTPKDTAISTDADTGSPRALPPTGTCSDTVSTLLVEAIEPAAARTRSPLLSLPVELLWEIIEHLPPNTPKSYAQKARLPSRVALTFVCTWLRKVGIAHRPSWPHLPIERNPTQWLAICLARGAPFRVDLSFKRVCLGHQSEELFNLICAKHDPLIAELNIELAEGPHVFYSHCSHECHINTKYLNRLSFDFRNPVGGYAYRGTLENPQHFQLDLNRGSEETTFRLKSLTLGACQISPSVLLTFRSLTDLRLHDCDIWNSLGAMLETLATMRDLRVLALSDNHTSLPVAALRPCVLPRLEHLDLVFPLDIIATLIDHLLLPPGVTFRLAQPRFSPLPLEAIALLGTGLGNALKPHLPSQPFGQGYGSLLFSTTERRSLSLEGRWSATGRVDGNTCDLEAFERHTLAPPALTLVVWSPTESELSLLDAMFATLGFSSCQTITLKEDWKDYHTYCALRTLWTWLSHGSLPNIRVFSTSFLAEAALYAIAPPASGSFCDDQSFEAKFLVRACALHEVKALKFPRSSGPLFTIHTLPSVTSD
ncbi:hypothetical protein OF83DRAFT_1168400 [Amylostereum chailletii]|nr:hypothetical protein OF83DRAFT_1168400 [Amylostereum chailletii]